MEFHVTGSEGGGEQTTRRKPGMAARLRPYHSIIQRKVLDPNDFERHWNEIAEPFEWNFTREKLAELMARLSARDPQLRLAA